MIRIEDLTHDRILDRTAMRTVHGGGNLIAFGDSLRNNFGQARYDALMRLDAPGAGTGPRPRSVAFQAQYNFELEMAFYKRFQQTIDIKFGL